MLPISPTSQGAISLGGCTRYRMKTVLSNAWFFKMFGYRTIIEPQFNSLPNDKILNRSKLKAFADNKINVTETLKFVLRWVENIVRKCWLPAFSPFPTMFSKGFVIRVIKFGDCVNISSEKLAYFRWPTMWPKT